jgi:hypothetical protein
LQVLAIHILDVRGMKRLQDCGSIIHFHGTQMSQPMSRTRVE